MNTKLLAQKIWESGDLFRDDSYDLHQLFQIRDACIILKKFGLGDKDLLKEVEKWIEQKTSE